MNDGVPEPNDPVWCLLEQAGPVEVRPDFSHRVIDAVRLDRAATVSRSPWTRALRTPAARWGWAAAAAMLVSGGWWVAHRPRGPALAGSDAVVATPASVAGGAAEELAAEIASEFAMIDEVDALLAPETAQDLVEEDLDHLLF